MAAWHQQLIEVLGAMGIREVRRLRGETGPRMFFEDLERETFGRLFGKRKNASRAQVTRCEQRLSTRVRPCREHRPIRTIARTLPTHRGPRRLPRAARVRRGFARGAAGPAALPQRDRQVQHPPRVELRGLRPVRRGLPVRRARAARGLSRRSCGRSTTAASGPSCAETGQLLHRRLPAAGPVAGRQPGLRDDGRLPLDARPAGQHLGHGRDGPPAGKAPGERGRGLGRRLRPAAVPLSARRRPPDLRREDISTELLLNRRNDSRPKITIDVPWYGGGMSFGSTNIRALLGKARVAKAFNSFTCTGEGGYPERFIPYKDHVITQVATGLFGVREETIQRARIVEFKYAQGAKPGLGGHLLGDKNTPSVAAMRETVVGVSLFSPFPFHSVYSVEDHKKHLDWIAHVNPRALLSAKVSTPVDVDMVAVGVYYAGGHIVHLDGSYGGTGAAPNIAKKNIAMPIEYAIGRVHQFLVAEGIRDQVTVIASGGIRTPVGRRQGHRPGRRRRA